MNPMSMQNKNQKSSNNLAQDKSMKAKRFMDTRSSLRQVCGIAAKVCYLFVYISIDCMFRCLIQIW